MPRRKDLKKILVVGAGPIIIGQACEFDYSGTQACKERKDLQLVGAFGGRRPSAPNVS